MCTTRGLDRIAGLPALVMCTACLWAAPAAADLNGRYLGSYQVSEAATTEDFMRHLIDLHAYDDLSRSVKLSFDLSLGYRFRPGESQTDLLDSRIFGDLRHPRWRVHAQYVPWQDATPGPSPARRREMQLGLDLTPARLPQLRLVFDRHDRSTTIQNSSVNDFRIEGSHTLGELGAHASYRRIQSAIQGGVGAANNTDQWKAGVLANHSWGRMAASAGYEAEYNTYELRDLSRKYYTQRVDAGGQWSARRNLRVGLASYLRWGRSEDNGPANDLPIDEKFLSGNVSYLPIRELELNALREYRSTQGLTEDAISDYLQLKAVLRKDLVRGLLFQNGYTYTADLHSRGGSIPQNGLYFLVSGRARRGVVVNGELRFATANQGEETSSSGTNVRRLLGVQLTPSRTVRVDGSWSRNTYPEFTVQSGVDSLPPTVFPSQEEEEWTLLLGYRPSSRIDLTGSSRWLDGRGRLFRRERFGSATFGYRFSDRTSLAMNWNRRVSQVGPAEIDTRALSTDLMFWLPREFRTKLGWVHNTTVGRPSIDNYNVTVEKRF
jgi:hypothetical protein